MRPKAEAIDDGSRFVYGGLDFTLEEATFLRLLRGCLRLICACLYVQLR